VYKNIDDFKARCKRRKVQEYVYFNALLTARERDSYDTRGFPDKTFEQCMKDKQFMAKYYKMVEYRDSGKHEEALKQEERSNNNIKRYSERCQCKRGWRIHSLRFDAYYCGLCNVWIEPRCCERRCGKSCECNFGEHCLDEKRRSGCEFCSDRPFSPIAPDGTHPDWRTDIQGGSDCLMGDRPNTQEELFIGYDDDNDDFEEDEFLEWLEKKSEKSAENSSDQ